MKYTTLCLPKAGYVNQCKGEGGGAAVKDRSAEGAPTKKRDEHVVMKEQEKVKVVAMVPEPEPEQEEQDEGEDQTMRTTRDGPPDDMPRR